MAAHGISISQDWQWQSVAVVAAAEGILTCPGEAGRTMTDAARNDVVGVFGPMRGQDHIQAADAAHDEVRGVEDDND